MTFVARYSSCNLYCWSQYVHSVSDWRTTIYPPLTYVTHSTFISQYPSFTVVLLHSNNTSWHRPMVSLVFNKNSFSQWNYYNIARIWVGSFHMPPELSKSVEWLQRYWFADIYADIYHWRRVMHICVVNLIIVGSDNGFSPGQHQAIMKTNAGILLIWPFGTNFSKYLFKVLTISLKKMLWKGHLWNDIHFVSASTC